MKSKAGHRILFDSSGCLTQQAIALFVDGNLSDIELRKIRKHTSNCELCADALEGAEHFSSAHVYNKRIKQMHNTRWRQSLGSRSKTRRLFYGISSVAASLIILFGVFFILRIDRVMKEELDLHGKSELVLSEAEDVSLPVAQQVMSTQKPETEAKLSKIEKIENLVKDDIKTIEEPSEIISDIDFESEIDLFEEEDAIVEEEIDFALDVDIVDEELMSVEYTTDAMAVSKAGYTDEAPAISAREELSSEKLYKASDKKKGLSRRSRAQKSSAEQSYYIAEVTPMFQGGGVDNFNSYLADNLKVIIPDSVMVESIIISFVVDTLGNVNKVKLVSGTSSDEWNDLIIEFVESSPVWIPGHLAGKAIQSEQQIEIVLDTLNRENNNIQ